MNKLRKMNSGCEASNCSKQKGDLYLASSLCDGVEDNNLKQVTTLLLNKEADPNVLMPLHGITPFHLVIGNDSEAFAEEVTKLFLRYGGNPNVKSIDGMTPVHIAAAWGRTKILDLLLANGGDPLCLDSDSCTPFHYAFEGGHYPAISLLSKYCINEEDKDEDPKYKLELDKVMVNNGEVLAEYLVSDNSFSSSSYKSGSFSSVDDDKYKSNTDGYVPESGSTDTNSPEDNNFVTVRKNQRKRLAEEKTNNILKNDEENYDFKRDTVQEEMDLLNEIISQLSSTLASDIDPASATFQKYENECLVSCKTSSPKRMQMTVTFNRPLKNNNKYANLVKNENINTKNSTLNIIKQHNNVHQWKNNRMVNSNCKKTPINTNKTFVSKKSMPTSTKKITPNSSKLQNLSSTKKVISSRSKLHTPVKESVLQSNWIDETILSKSPNLHINMNSKDKKKKLIKTPIFEKKVSPVHTKICKKSSNITPVKVRSITPNKLSNIYHTPNSCVPKPKKYFTTPSHLKTTKRAAITPDQISKTKFGSLKKSSTDEKLQYSSPLNVTYKKSESSTLSFSSDNKSCEDIERRKSLKDVAVNLTSLLSDKNDEETSMAKNQINHKNFKVDGSEIMSGIKMLDSGITSKSDSITYEEKPIGEEITWDLNRAILDSLSNAQSESLENENSINFNRPINILDSMLCQQGSLSSISSDSYLSLGNVDDAPIDNNVNNKSESHNGEIKSEVCSDESLSSSRKLDAESFFSVEEEYKYEDPDEGVAFLERRLCVSPAYASSDMSSSFYSISTAKSEPLPRELFLLDNIELRQRLQNLGDNPGPITHTTYHLYLKRLHKLQSGGRKHTQTVQTNHVANTQSRSSFNANSERALLRSSLLSIDWIHRLDDFAAEEQKVFQEFVSPNPSRKWREGTAKSSFNYLLLDPRITRDLPRRAANLSLSEKWETFLSAIFYIGKGKRSRPYEHLYDAFKVWVSKGRQRVSCTKIQRIMDIWNENKGVVVLHVFHNTIPVEAYTREAAMIEVLGTNKLGNCKYGDYYGVVSTWRSKEKCELGRYLLFKAMQILLLEGERQIFPDNL